MVCFVKIGLWEIEIAITGRNRKKSADMSHTPNLLSSSEEVVLLQQLEMSKHQGSSFPPEVERLYAKLMWRKVFALFYL